MIIVDNLSKKYLLPSGNLEVINNLSLKIARGEKVAIIGPSGSGKSTLLNIISGIETYDGGSVIVDNEDYSTCKRSKLDKIRLEKYGFVFQAFYLVDTLNVYDNIILPVLACGLKVDEKYVNELLDKLGLVERVNFYQKQLSGGEQQRVAIARALINKPKIIFADEPTGNLDKKNSKSVAELLCQCCNKYNQTLVLVTHDNKITEYMDRVIELQ